MKELVAITIGLMLTIWIIYIYYINIVVVRRKIRLFKKGVNVIADDMYAGKITSIFKIKNKYIYRIEGSPYWHDLDNLEILEEQD